MVKHLYIQIHTNTHTHIYTLNNEAWRLAEEENGNTDFFFNGGISVLCFERDTIILTVFKLLHKLRFGLVLVLSFIQYKISIK